MKKINIKDMPISEILEVSRNLHFEICELTSLMKKQNEGSGIKLKTLRLFRTLTIKAGNLDLQMRTLSKQIGSEIHEANVKKWVKKKEKE